MPVVLDNSNLLDYFPSVTEKIPVFFYHENAVKLLPKFDEFNPYYFKNRNSDTLLVTLGDSWTWAMECIGRSDFDDFRENEWTINNRVISNINQDRINHAYGNIVSDKINSDWLNLSVPGWGNFQIAELIENLSTIISQLSYKKIILVCTFTEIGRWFNTNDDVHIDHSRLLEQVKITNDVNTLLKELNHLTVTQILNSLDKFSHVQLLVGTNFVDHLGLDALSPEQILPQPWYQLLNISFDFPVYVGSYMPVDGIARGMSDGLIPEQLHTLCKAWVVDTMEKSKIHNKILFSSTYFKSGRYKHPQPSGHKIWADYIVKHIC